MNRRYDNPNPNNERPPERWGRGHDDESRGGEAGERQDGGAWGYDRGDQSPSLNPDYSNRYATPARAGERGRWAQDSGRDFDHHGGAGGGRLPRGGGDTGYGGGLESAQRDPGGGYAGGYAGRGYYGGSGGPSGGQYGGDYGAGRPEWRNQSYNEYESETRLPQMGGGGNAWPRFHGGGRYTSAGYSSGMSDDPAREFGASYGSASGYGSGQPRYGGAHEGEGGGYAGSMYGAGAAATRERGPHRTFARDHEREYMEGAGGGAFGSGYAGEYGGSERVRDSEARDFRGRGPKGYARSDERLQEDICERLTDDPYIDASDIDIAVRNGIVTLSGAVSDRWMKYHAEDLIDRCQGVRDIQNQLGVRSNRNRDASASQRGPTTTRGNEEPSQSAAGEGTRKRSLS